MRFIFLFFAIVNSEKFIKNMNVNPCRKCIYFKEDSIISLSKCEKFGEKNIVSNEISYNYVDNCRDDDLKCGKEGKYFEEDENADFKILKNQITNNIFIKVIVFPFILSLTLTLISDYYSK